MPKDSDTNSSPSWFDELVRLPVLHWFEPSALQPAHAAGRCGITELPAISDLQAQTFETNAGSAAAVDVAGLTPATSHALNRFRQIVTRVGGTLTLTSAFRPSPYQEHLQAVWDRWQQLRGNTEQSCQMLRAAVEQEFTRHQLLSTQRPVPFSDHTRGIGFDAWLTLPARAHSRRRVSLDSLARLAGLRRPDARRDPVHFRLASVKA